MQSNVYVQSTLFDASCCRGTDRMLGLNHPTIPGEAPWRKMVCIRRRFEDVVVEPDWEQWVETKSSRTTNALRKFVTLADIEMCTVGFLCERKSASSMANASFQVSSEILKHWECQSSAFTCSPAWCGHQNGHVHPLPHWPKVGGSSVGA